MSRGCERFSPRNGSLGDGTGRVNEGTAELWITPLGSWLGAKKVVGAWRSGEAGRLGSCASGCTPEQANATSHVGSIVIQTHTLRCETKTCKPNRCLITVTTN